MLIVDPWVGLILLVIAFALGRASRSSGGGVVGRRVRTVHPLPPDDWPRTVPPPPPPNRSIHEGKQPWPRS